MIEKTVAKLDGAFFEDGVVKPLSEKNWSDFVSLPIKSRMDFIETTFLSEEELTRDIAYKMTDEIAIITQSYEALVGVYEANKDKLTERKVKIIKEMAFHMRSWISNYSAKIITKGQITIPKGYNYDSPKPIFNQILEND